MTRNIRPALILAAAGLLLAACGAATPEATPLPPSPTPFPTPTPEVITHDPNTVAQIAIERDPDVPDLPFLDNPDPLQCGIPVRWGDANNRAWLSGFYEGELVQPTVFLYDSHWRRSIVARAPHGAEVQIVLYQANPVLDFYLVRVVEAAEGEAREGWVPAPFLSFEPLTG